MSSSSVFPKVVWLDNWKKFPTTSLPSPYRPRNVWPTCERAYPLTGPRLDEGNREGAPGPLAGGPHVSGPVRGGERGRRELLSVIESDDLGEVRRGAARSPGQDCPAGDRIRRAGARSVAAGSRGDHRRQDLAGVRDP